ncbi:hypothetical protein U9M48_039090 [Paspalum notatum var. saurae]|uniref:Uncharacterized protein n=1 Tax=Paspalum notatum var. saurae TaxID=547442 RepID=A0AAQ3UN82_PASNO
MECSFSKWFFLANSLPDLGDELPGIIQLCPFAQASLQMG